MGPIEIQIRGKLQAAFQPFLLEIVNDSSRHSGHAGAKEFADKMGEGFDGIVESHFSIKIGSAKFDGVGRLARQRMVMDLLKDEMKVVHALALKTVAVGEN
jgi:BolA protein